MKQKGLRRAGVALVLLGAALWGLSGCAVVTGPGEPATLAERLAAFPDGALPVEKPVTVHWDDHQIPYVRAKTDADAAFTLGLVHAHLRLAQLHMARHIVEGRLSALAGPWVTDVDHALRTLDLDRAAGKVVAGMPDRTRRWVARFADGLNYYQQNTEELPHEFAVLGMKPDPWTAEDIVGIGRLAGADVTWLVWWSLLPMRERDDWPAVYRDAIAKKMLAPDSVPAPGSEKAARHLLRNIVAGLSKSGSNAVAVSDRRSKGDGALLASDPHLGTMLPNLWITAGVKSPSYQVVGLMPAGLPFFALGRNRDIAWAGTNLRAVTSDLVDVSGLPDEAITERTETIPVRFWFDEEITIRESPFGPVVSDIPLWPGKKDGPPLALRWMGHRESHEITAMLRVARADGWQAYRRAFDGFAVSGQTMLYAGKKGDVGLVTATRLPRREKIPDTLVIQPERARRTWADPVRPDELPAVHDPPAGYVASANNPPAGSDVPLGWFFSAPDRILRLHRELAGPSRLSPPERAPQDGVLRGFAPGRAPEDGARVLSDGARRLEVPRLWRGLERRRPAISRRDLMALQTDTRSPGAVALRDAVVARADTLGLEAAPLERIRGWDGRYRRDSRDALAFEGFFAAFAPELFEEQGRTALFDRIGSSGHVRWWTLEALHKATDAAARAAIRAGLKNAREALDRHDTWGEAHRLKLAHPLSNLPLIGSRYAYVDVPAGGSRQTLMKTAHGLQAGERHAVHYGSQARQVNDLGDPDANWFALLGGQDGWLDSTTLHDQVPLWQAGEYVKVPLTLESVRQRFGHRHTLTPAEP